MVYIIYNFYFCNYILVDLDLTSKENSVNYRRLHNLVSCIPFNLKDNSGGNL